MCSGLPFVASVTVPEMSMPTGVSSTESRSVRQPVSKFPLGTVAASAGTPSSAMAIGACTGWFENQSMVVSGRTSSNTKRMLDP